MMVNRKKQNNEAIGLAISDSSLSLVKIYKEDGSKKTVQNSVSVSEGVLENGVIKNKEALGVAFKNLFSDKNLSPEQNYINFVVTNNGSYFHIFDIKKEAKKNEIDQAVINEIKKSIPLKFNKILYEYSVLKNNLIAVKAVDKTFVDNWKDFFENEGYESSYDVGFSSLVSVINKPKNQSYFIFDIEKETINVMFVFEKVLIFNCPLYLDGYYEKMFNDDFFKKVEQKEGIENDSNSKGVYQKIDELFGFVQENFRRNKFDVVFLGDNEYLENLKNSLENNFKNRINKVEIANQSLFPDLPNKKYILPLSLSLKNKINNDIIKKVVYQIFAIFNIKSKYLKYYLSAIFIILSLIFFLSFLNKKEDVKSYGLSYETFINLDKNLEQGNFVNGRIIKNIVNEPGDYDTAISKSKSLALLELTPGEKLYFEPLGELDKNHLIFPIELEWMAYNELEFKNFIYEKIKKYSGNKSENGKIELNNVLLYEDGGVYFLKTDLNLISSASFNIIGFMLDGKINKEEIKKSVPEKADENSQEIVEEKNKVKVEEKKREKVIIKNISNKSVNVRSGPGVGYPVIYSVFNNEEYNYLKTENNWYEIEIKDKIYGWVFSELVEKISY